MDNRVNQKVNIQESTLVKPVKTDSTNIGSVYDGYFEGGMTSTDIAKILAEAIYGLGGNKDISEYIKLIDRDNFKAVMKAYKEISEQKKAGLESKIPNWLPGREKILSTFTPKESLLTAIYNESGLDKEEKSQMMYKIIQLLVQPENKDIAEDIIKNEIENYTSQKSGAYTGDIIQDLMNNKDDASKALVDIYRKVYRETLKASSEEIISTNGKIDKSFEQGEENDCWLIAGVISIASSEKGKEYLNSLLEKNDSTGDITVELRGVGEKIVVTQEEIKAMSHLSTGDGDVRAIEIAIDKYTRNNAYRNAGVALTEDKSINKADIAFDGTTYCYDLLVGNSEKIENASEKILSGEIDLKDSNKNYVFSSGDWILCEIEVYPCYNTLVRDHAYSVTRSDENYIYIIDPCESEKECKVPKTELENARVLLESCELPK